MKIKEIPFSAEDLVRSVEEVRDRITGKRKVTLRTTKLKLPKSTETTAKKHLEVLHSA